MILRIRFGDFLKLGFLLSLQVYASHPLTSKNPHLIETSTICEVQLGNATFFVYLPTAPCTIAPLAASLDQEYQYIWEPQTLL